VRIFEQPYFVPAHAVRRFQQRVADLPREEVLGALQGALQTAQPVLARSYDGKLSLVLEAEYNGKKLYCPVLYTGKAEEWPVVLTVETEGQHIEKQLTRPPAKLRRPWTAQDDRTLQLLRAKGFTVRECARLMRRGHNTIQAHLPRTRARPLRRWTEEEKEKAVQLYARGKSYAYIAKKLGRTQNAVEIFFCRRRKAIRADPEKQMVLKILSFCLNPSRVLKAIRGRELMSLAEEGLI
jgi:transposase-like protein